MSRQRVFAPTADVLTLLRRRAMPVSGLRNAACREAILAAEPGAIAIIHDPEGMGALAAGKPMPLVLAASRTVGKAPHVELVVKQAEAISLYNRTANQPRPATCK